MVQVLKGLDFIGLRGSQGNSSFKIHFRFVFSSGKGLKSQAPLITWAGARFDSSGPVGSSPVGQRNATFCRYQDTVLEVLKKIRRAVAETIRVCYTLPFMIPFHVVPAGLTREPQLVSPVNPSWSHL
eukprot:jgi/Botrbrau1/14609/Bobra.67_2s0009.1